MKAARKYLDTFYEPDSLAFAIDDDGEVFVRAESDGRSITVRLLAIQAQNIAEFLQENSTPPLEPDKLWTDIEW